MPQFISPKPKRGQQGGRRAHFSTQPTESTMDHAEKAETAALVMAAKTAPPTISSAAMLLGYPVEHWILWLTLAWWLWLFAEKITGKVMAWRDRRKKPRGKR